MPLREQGAPQEERENIIYNNHVWTYCLPLLLILYFFLIFFSYYYYYSYSLLFFCCYYQNKGFALPRSERLASTTIRRFILIHFVSEKDIMVDPLEMRERIQKCFPVRILLIKQTKLSSSYEITLFCQTWLSPAEGDPSEAPFGFWGWFKRPVLGKPEVSKQGSRKALVRKAANRTTVQREAACPSVTCGLGLAFQLSIRSDPLFHRFRGKTKDLARPVRQKNSKEKERYALWRKPSDPLFLPPTYP